MGLNVIKSLCFFKLITPAVLNNMFLLISGSFPADFGHQRDQALKITKMEYDLGSFVGHIEPGLLLISPFFLL